MRSTLSFLFILFFSSTVFAQTDFYSKRWSRVYKYELRSLPQSANSVVDTIYRRAQRENNIPQLTKALIYQSKFSLALKEDAELLITKKFLNEIAEAKAPLKNILESLLAKIYWDYFQQNRWKYYDRSRTDKKEGDDFRLWDAETMFVEIHKHYQNSLRQSKLLQQIDLITINDILAQAENSKIYRPTLFDFITHNALEFYETGENYISKAATDFEINDLRLFEEFENIKLVAEDSLSPAYLALKLYQALSSFHKNDKDQSPYISNELDRLDFIVNKGTFENAVTLHKKALTKLKSTYATYPASTLIDFQIALLLTREGSRYKSHNESEAQFKKREALAVIEEAIVNFPKSIGAEQCKMLREQILQTSLEMKAEEHVPINKPFRLLITYTNIDSIRVFSYPLSNEFASDFRFVSDSVKQARLSSMAPEAEWKTVLPSRNDYQEHSTEVVIPGLKNGMHLLVCRPSASKMYAFAIIQATNLALIENSFGDRNRYQIIDRNTGVPMAGVKVNFRNSRNSSQDTINKTLVTDRNGFVELKKSTKRFYGIQANVDYPGDKPMFVNYYLDQYYHKDNDEEELTAKAFLFSDRSIYRPGQTVFFKGILIKTKGEKSTLVAGQFVEVALEDANGQEIGTLRLKTNSYGSFSGEFKLPTSGLTGEYTLSVDEDDEDESKFYDKLDDFFESRLNISVEEYKRPTFEVTFKPVKETFKLNDSIKIYGNAMTFSGSKISGGKVSYRVRRNVRYPSWPYWGRRNTYSKELEIDHGNVVTNADGDFTVTFKSIPDEKIAKDELPIFEFEVVADVTDVNGETRSATSTVRVGYHSMTASIGAKAAINRKNLENVFSISTENLNGQVVPAQGTVRIYKVKSPSAPQRPRPWSAPDLQKISEEQFAKLFPNDPYIEEPDLLKKGKLMTELPFNTAATGNLKFKVDDTWALGSYFIELTTSDETGTPVKATHSFELFDPASKSVPDNKVLVIEADKSIYSVGEVARVKIGSASKDITVVIDVERNGEIVNTYVKHLNGNFTEISIPITEADKSGLTIHYGAANYNAFFPGTNKILVNDEKGKLEIETISFKDKLQPGAKETWSFEVKSADPLKKQAEVLASMYDASLDQFRSHQWNFDPKEEKYDYSSARIAFYESFGVTNFIITNQVWAYDQVPHLYFDSFDDFGFSITGNYHVKQNYYYRIYSESALTNNSKITLSNNKDLRKGYISGRITDEDGSPIPGVNVLIKGTTIGTVTDTSGSYTLPAAKGDEIVYSFIGYSTIETKVGKKNVFNVTLATDVKQLSEVVVTALGVDKTKRSLSVATAAIMALADSTREGMGEVVFEEPKMETVAETGNEVLQGVVAGVQITGMPGGSRKLLIRGYASMDSQNPLYVVDGVITESSKIDKDDLAAVQVLKGDAATALYGSRGANGVIIITTKSGQKKLDEELAKINARKNFNETAFFFPHLTTDENGKIQFNFTTPESLTRWKLQLFAHNRELESGIKTLNAVTQKDFMVTPNAPRFLRAGDEISFSAKIINLTGNELRGNAALLLTNAITGEPVDQLFQNTIKTQSFKVSPKGNAQVIWKLKIPATIDAIQYKVVAKAGNFSDGEQNALPVLSNRTLVTETLPMFIRADESKTFTMEKLKTNTSATLQHHQLTLEVTTNPAWYAVQSLPYLMEFPHECSEQTFARYYANTLASHIANSNPKAKHVFDQWASSGALISNLEKNSELKSIIIQETPWLRDAQDETEQKKRIALLFDLNTMADQRKAAINKLEELQLTDGGFTWFAGGKYSSRYITQHIASGFGHLRSLKVVNDKDDFFKAVKKAILYLDNEVTRDYNELLNRANSIKANAKSLQDGVKLEKEYLDRQQVRYDHIHYLYMRTFFPEIEPSSDAKKAITYYRDQSATYWKNFNLYLRGMTALIHYRNRNTSLARDIMKSLKENSIVSEEMGMYWKENKAGWYWSESPIETQALLIEAFSEIEFDASQSVNTQKIIDDLRIWLLKNKQTNQWQTTKATTEAIYALLLKGTEWLSIKDKVEVSVGGKKVSASAQTPEAGTGYFKTSWKGNSVTPEMGKVKITKKGEGIAWAGLYWQYFEDLDKITGAETPLKLFKKVFVVSRTDKGELLTEVNPNTPIAIGSRLRIRIELRTDRDMEFLHMKDMRAAGLEPIDVLSEYKWQENLGYYQSTKDASTNFFFDSLPKGAYVFEYDLRVNNAGNFSNGITTIQCMYAPEFSSHSEGIRITVE